MSGGLYAVDLYVRAPIGEDEIVEEAIVAITVRAPRATDALNAAQGAASVALQALAAGRTRAALSTALGGTSW